MAITSLLIGADQRTVFKDNTGKADILILDVTKTITPKYSATVTDHPVEKGNSISDHIRPNNIEITLEGYISESPLTLEASLAGIATSAFSGAATALGGQLAGAVASVAGGLGAAALLKSSDKAAATRDILIGLIEDRVTFRISAPSLSKKYLDADYVMTSVTFPKDQSTGRGIAFSASMKQIRLVSSLTVPISKLKSPHSTAKSSDLGKQAASEASEGNKKSILKFLSGFVGGGK